MMNLLKLAGFLSLLAITAPGTMAQLLESAPQSDAQIGARQQLMEARRQIQQLNRELIEIQQETLSANPSLEAQRDDFVAMVDAEMASEGVAPDAARDRIEELQQELEGSLPEQEKAQLQQQLRQEIQSYGQAQQAAMSKPALAQEQQALNRALLTAMQDQNARTETIVSNLRVAQRRYQQIMQAAMEAGSQ